VGEGGGTIRKENGVRKIFIGDVQFVGEKKGKPKAGKAVAEAARRAAVSPEARKIKRVWLMVGWDKPH